MPPKKEYTLKVKVWIWKSTKPKAKSKSGLSNGSWHFVTIPKKQSDEIKKNFGSGARGWGSLPVKAQIGSTEWRTSIFPDKQRGAYVLPLKADVRKKEEIKSTDTVTLHLTIRP